MTKVTKVQLDQPSVPLEARTEMRKDLKEETVETSNSKLMNAEEATKAAIGFLKSLDVKKIMPNKVSNEGNRAYVELDLKGKKAAVLVDRKTKEILEYEIEKTEKVRLKSPGPVWIKLVLLVVLIQFLLTILFGIIKPYIPLPLP